MEIHYKEYSFGKEQNRVDHIPSFVASQLLTRDDHRGYGRDKLHLEEQIPRIADCIGRLLDWMLEQQLITPDQFHKIIDSDYGFEHRSEIKKGAE